MKQNEKKRTDTVGMYVCASKIMVGIVTYIESTLGVACGTTQPTNQNGRRYLDV